MSDRITDHGFTFGPMEVARIMDVDGRGCVLGVKSVAGVQLQVFVSTKGKSVRVWRDGKELK